MIVVYYYNGLKIVIYYLTLNYLLYYHLKNPRIICLKKQLTTPPIVPPVPSILVHDSLSQSSGEGQIQEIIESSPEQNLLDLQPSQRLISGPSEQVPPRKGERIHLQHEKNLSSRSVTRSQTVKNTGEKMANDYLLEKLAASPASVL